MAEIELAGCSRQPLGAYLKALAVLRLVSQEQPDAHGFWNGQCFVLSSAFDNESLLDFFLLRYQPTPLLAPWNGGSGFYPKDRKVGIEALLAASGDRFSTYRHDLSIAATIVDEVGAVADEDQRRSELLRRCRNELSDACVEWLDAAIAISADESRAFAPILGTGGNEGRLDYTNNFMENLSRLLIKPDKKAAVDALLKNALFGTHTPGLQAIAVGQYDPGRAGGFNQGNGIAEDSIANPWTAILTMEGAVAWAGGIYRKQGVSYRSFLCSPFTVRPSPVGYGSAAENDEGSARAEIWAPVWSNPTRFAELRTLLREGRAAVDGRAAQNGLEFAEAAASLGVDRGIKAFVRYSLLKRRGDSYIALPAGTFPVEYRSTADLIRELTPFLDQAAFAAKGPGGEVPNTWPSLMRTVKAAMFQALLHGRKDALVEVAGGFGAMYKWLLERKREVSWRGWLGGGWLEASWETKKSEVRIAAALANMWSEDAGSILENLDPLSSRLAWTGRNLEARMLSTLKRRVLDGGGSDKSPFSSQISASSSDVVAFLERHTDDELIESLIFAFLRVKRPEQLQVDRDDGAYRRWPGYCVLKQFFAASTHPNGTTDEPRFRPDAAIAGLLDGGKVKESVNMAIRRLRIAGVIPIVSSGWDSEDSFRLGAALLIPTRDVGRLRDWIAVPKEETRSSTADR